jgi:hypothetical protein
MELPKSPELPKIAKIEMQILPLINADDTDLKKPTLKSLRGNR